MRKFVQLLLNEHNVFSFQLVSFHNYSFYVKWDFCELEIRVRVFTNYTDDKNCPITVNTMKFVAVSARERIGYGTSASVITALKFIQLYL